MRVVRLLRLAHLPDVIKHELQVRVSVLRVGAHHAPEVLAVALAALPHHGLAVARHQLLHLRRGIAQLVTDLDVVQDILALQPRLQPLRHLLEARIVRLGLVDQNEVRVLLHQVCEDLCAVEHGFRLFHAARPAVFLNFEPHLQDVDFATTLNGFIASVQRLVLILAVGHEELLGFHGVAVVH